jgi:hypothetical protein
VCDGLLAMSVTAVLMFVMVQTRRPPEHRASVFPTLRYSGSPLEFFSSSPSSSSLSSSDFVADGNDAPSDTVSDSVQCLRGRPAVLHVETASESRVTGWIPGRRLPGNDVTDGMSFLAGSSRRKFASRQMHFTCWTGIFAQAS